MWGTDSHYWLTRFCFQRALAGIYAIAFLVGITQFRGLLGEHGLEPVSRFVGNVPFWDSPSLFYWQHSDRFVISCLAIGLILALIAVTGLSEMFGLYVSAIVWAAMWLLYLSIVNVGQTFYSFGWESLLLETGFLAIFLGSAKVAPPTIVIWLLRWVLFRIMFGAGMIKLRGDPCWRNLTCLAYHYETQPMPNPLSWYFYQLPMWVHKSGVLFTFFAELVAPFGIFFPQPICAIAGLSMIALQVMIALSGNLSFLNYLTIVLCIPCFTDAQLARFIPIHIPETDPIRGVRFVILSLLTLLIGYLSIQPIRNLFSRYQSMNRSYDPLHLVGTYGAFGSVTPERDEVIIEGTNDDPADPNAMWKSYEIPGKPGDLYKRPPLIAPYHDRLGWLMWFAAMNDFRYHRWFPPLMIKLLQGEPAVLGLLSVNPFPDAPPKYIRARLFEYYFATPDERKSGQWWQRQFIRDYFPTISLENLK